MAAERTLAVARAGIQAAIDRRDELEGKIANYRSMQEQRRQRLEWVRGAKEASTLMAELDLARSVLAKEEAEFMRSGDAVTEAERKAAEAEKALQEVRAQQAPLRETLAGKRDGIAAPELARAFLRPELERLSDPLAWADMRRAVDLIAAAVRARTPILVHGDYDVDGQCAAALLTRVLASVGADVRAFVPHRLRDGYDFGAAGLAEARRVGAGLIVTCDCGITAVDAVGAARAAGIDVIVTDHHLPGDDPAEAAAIARELETLNARRQALDQRILDEALELAERVLRPEDRALVLAADAWHPGVIGIVASRLVERYGRPTFLIAWDEGGSTGRGSGRSIAGFDLHAALHRVAPHLEKYGGHTMAAGLTIRRDRYEAFRVAFLAVAGELLRPDDLVPAQRVDLELPLGLVSEELEKLIR